MVGPLKKQVPTTILALAFEENQVQAAHLRRSSTGAQLLKSCRFEISGNPFALEPEILGREIRKNLDEHDIKESRCVVALPLQWVLSFQAPVPEMSADDVDAFLMTEAERNFPYDPESLFISSSKSRLPDGEFATVTAVQREQILKLQSALKVAHLKALSFTVGITAVQPPDELQNASVAALYIGAKGVELEVVRRGGVIALRALEGALEQSVPEPRVFPDVIGRELRVSLGQVPEAVRSELRKLRVFGRRDTSEKLLAELSPRLASLGLSGEFAKYSMEQGGEEATAAFSTGARYLLQKSPIFEFLPPKVSGWKQFSSKTSSRKIAWAGVAVGAAALILTGAFFIQNWQLSRLRTEWAAMEPRVKELQDMQQQIKRFRPWFDTSFRNLSILRTLTEAFPADGIVSAKVVEIRNDSQVTCSGVARDNQALFRIMDHLRSAREVSDVNGPDFRGKNPLQFTFNFKWLGGGGGERQ
jgi:hypothetical protein